MSPFAFLHKLRKAETALAAIFLGAMPLLFPSLAVVSAESLRATVVLSIISALFLLASAQSAVISRANEWAVALAVPAFSALILYTMESSAEMRLVPLWLCLSGLSAGLFLGASSVETSPVCQPKFLQWIIPALVLTALGAALRSYGLDFGIPSFYHPDERVKVRIVSYMLSEGSLDPHYFRHPSGLLYSTLLVCKIRQALGSAADIQTLVWTSGRLVSAISGSASVFLLFLLSLRLFSFRTAIVSSALLAVFPLHVASSRYLKEDALLTFMVLLCAVITVEAVKRDRKSLLLAAGLTAGLAASVKYTGVFSLILVAYSPWLKSRTLRPQSDWIGYACLACACSVAGFLLLSPFAAIDPLTFINGVSYEKRHMETGHTAAISAWSQLWMFQFARGFMGGAGTITALVAMAGAGIMLRRRRAEDLFIVMAFLFFYLPAEWVKAKPEPQPERYVMPCLPFLAIMAAKMIYSNDWIISPQRWRRMLPGLASLLVLFPAAMRSVAFSSEIMNDTRAKAAHWMIDNLQAGSKFLTPLPAYGPDLTGSALVLSEIPASRILDDLRIDSLRKSGADYLVLSTIFYQRYWKQTTVEPMHRYLIREIFGKLPIVQEFSGDHPYAFHNPTITLFSLKPADFDKLNAQITAKREGKLVNTTNDKWNKKRWTALRY